MATLADIDASIGRVIQMRSSTVRLIDTYTQMGDTASAARAQDMLAVHDAELKRLGEARLALLNPPAPTPPTEPAPVVPDPGDDLLPMPDPIESPDNPVVPVDPNPAPIEIIPIAKANDWRARLRLAPSADYLYRATNPGILAPLVASDGVVFPYTPSINVVHHARYTSQQLPHSNWNGYFYNGSSLGEIQLEAKFTAQDTFEAAYLLAVIHFFRSVTKMFYGQDELRGVPPPLLFLSAFGEYQYSNSPCLVSEFNYSLPDDVDYIRVSGESLTENIFAPRAIKRAPATVETAASIARLESAKLTLGGLARPAATPSNATSKTTAPTYVPSLMTVSLMLLPVQNRESMSSEFSLKDYATGNLILKGYY